MPGGNRTFFFPGKITGMNNYRSIYRTGNLKTLPGHLYTGLPDRLEYACNVDSPGRCMEGEGKYITLQELGGNEIMGPVIHDLDGIR